MTKKIYVLLLLLAISVASVAQKRIAATEIIRTIKNGDNVTYTNVIIEGNLDFTSMEEELPKLPKRSSWWNNGGSNTVENTITAPIRFSKCIFKGDVLAYIPHEKSGYTFVSNFSGDVIFEDCLFEEKAMFKYSKFKKVADFSNTKFTNDSTFKYAYFSDQADFSNTLFEEPATFKYAKFDEFISFRNSIFEETATFKYTEFYEGVSFNNVKFKQDLNLKYTKIKGDFDIRNMEVDYEIDTKYTEINGQSFSKYSLKTK
ncbi:pentapeptide repeat-containing protein [Tenacibaculum sp. SG-28]|uniref:pentapeptide repeat-containing protein n=1 Tax=Tenacibaculum sp. SG-28 TaxID=754426 RepID=UPI000CF563DA|nr:pentapeptide repeat-containing protein [Tenacibaculum sp. SG-28]PQJ19916.1 hypothetical protein BSU00_11390 [Tenacibaculum sp. SG-28]